ncbi:MAG: ACT domain-containing protein, partial [Paracoccaceae bacterium]
ESKDELLARLGSAELSARNVVEVLYPELGTVEEELIEPSHAVIGLSPEQRFTRAACCQPVPGERIVGIAYRGKGVLVHAIDCPVLGEFEEQSDRWVDLRWNSGRYPPVHTVSMDITISNDAGVLGRICTLIGEHNANITDLVFTDRKPDFYRMIIDVNVRDVEHLINVQTALEADSDVTEVSRFRSGDSGSEAAGA